MSEEAKKEMEASLKALKLPTTFYTYPGTGHWFMETDRSDAYNAEAANLAWERTIAFLKEHLVA
jgi:carboxymethylenebutenolidase